MLRDASIGEILVQPDELEQRVRQLGAEVSRDYANKDPVSYTHLTLPTN